MEEIIHGCKKGFPIFEHPVCKRGTADLCTKTAKILFNPIKRHTILQYFWQTTQATVEVDAIPYTIWTFPSLPLIMFGVTAF